MGKTDYSKLNNLGELLEEYSKNNGFEVKRCSEYQWNLNFRDILLSVYPGSGLIYATHLHYANTGLIDKTGCKYYFHNKKTMVSELDRIMFAVDKI